MDASRPPTRSQAHRLTSVAGWQIVHARAKRAERKRFRRNFGDKHAVLRRQGCSCRYGEPIRMIDERLPEPIEPMLQKQVVGIEPSDGPDDIRMREAQTADAFVDGRGLPGIRLAAPEVQLRRARRNQLARAVGRASIEDRAQYRDIRSTEGVQRSAQEPFLVQARYGYGDAHSFRSLRITPRNEEPSATARSRRVVGAQPAVDSTPGCTLAATSCHFQDQSEGRRFASGTRCCHPRSRAVRTFCRP